MMKRLRTFMHEFKLVLSIALLVGSLILLILSIFGYPDSDGNEGSGPLAGLRGINAFVMIITLITALFALYILIRYNNDRSKFRSYMNTHSQAIFKKNQLEIERLALRLTSREEMQVLDAIKKYKIK